MAAPQTLTFDAPAAPPSTLKFDDQAPEEKKKTAAAAPAKQEEPFFGHIQTTLGNMATGLAKNAWDVSTPGIAASMLKRFRPGTLPAQVERDTTPLKELPNEIGETMAPILAGGILEEPAAAANGERPVARAARPNEPKPRPVAPAAKAAEEPSTMLGRVGKVAMRRISDIPGVQAVKDLDYVIRGKGGPEVPKAPTPKPPATEAPIPTTEGIPWGQPGHGPIDLRGKRIPVEPPELTSKSRTLPGEHEPERIEPEKPELPIPGVNTRPSLHRIAPSRGLALPPAAIDVGAPLPERPSSELLQARGLAQGGKPVPEEKSAGLGRIRVAQHGIEPEPIPAREEGAAPAAQAQAAENAPAPSAARPLREIPSPARIRELKNDIEASVGPSAAEEPKRDLSSLKDLDREMKKALGVEDVGVKPFTKLKNQRSPAKPIAVPEGHTPVESSALRSYKYDPDAREFEYVTNDGTHYVRGDVGPEAFREFLNVAGETDSIGKGWHALRNHPEGGVPQFKVDANGERIPIKPGQLRVAPGKSIPKAASGLAPDLPVEGEEDLSAQMQRMLNRALDIKRAGGKVSPIDTVSHEPLREEGITANPNEHTGRIDTEPKVSSPLRASSPTTGGAETRVRVPGETQSYRATYQVRELEDVQPSHSGETFQPNPKYQLTNDRDYSNRVNQGKIIENAGDKFDPAFHITDNPDAVNGPIVIDSEGHALGGNGRTMILQRVYKSNPAGAAAYKNMLVSRAQNFGLDPEAVGRMKRPVLVREIDNAEFEQQPSRKQDAITDFNKKGTAEMTPAERAIADARRVSNDTLDMIGGMFEDAGVDSTLADIFRGGGGNEILDRLVRDGALTPQDKAAFASESGLTQAGKDRISNLVVARFFDDPAEMDSAPPSLKTKLEKLAPTVAHVEGQAGWDLTERFREAMKLLGDARAHGSTIDDLLRQRGIFGESKYSPDAVAIARQLKDAPTPVVLKAARQYAADAADARRPLILGEPVSPDQAFRESFGKQTR